MFTLSLRTKFLLSVGLIMFLALGTSTLVNVLKVKHDYLEAVEWRSEALAHAIISNLSEQQDETPLETVEIPKYVNQVSRQALKLYEVYRQKDVSHIALLDEQGSILVHTDSALLHTTLEHPGILAALSQQKSVTLLADTLYHTLIPIVIENGAYLGSLDIGVPKGVVDDKVQEVLFQAAWLFALFLSVSVGLVFLMMYFLLTNPVNHLVAVGQKLAEGSPIHMIYAAGRQDEIGAFAVVFSAISSYFRNIARIASRIATGVLGDDVDIRSERDILGKAVKDMLTYLRNVATMMTHIAEGNLSDTVQPRSTEDAFGQAIQTMTEGLRTLISQIRTSAEQIASTGLNISSLAAHDIEIVLNVNSSMKTMMSTMLQTGTSVEDVAVNMNTLSSSVEQTSVSVSRMTTSIVDIAESTNSLTERTHRAIEAVNEAVATLNDVVKNTDDSKALARQTIQEALDGQQAVEQVMTGMETIERTITAGVETIQRLVQRSKEIGTILEVIRDITEQTSLLALNASIIAAQAGSHGRGFAVVADEIKNLADGVGTSTKDISIIVKKLHQDTDQVVKTIHEGAKDVKRGMEQTYHARETLQRIINSAERSSAVVATIDLALGKLMGTSQAVNTAMEEVDQMTDSITLATNEQKMSTSQIDDAIAHINTMTSHIQQATTEQLTGVQKMLEAASYVSSVIEQNLESSQSIALTTETLAFESQTLLRSVDRFKLNT